MNVPNNVLRVWRKELTSVDDRKIAETFAKHKRTIRRAREEGRCNESTYNAINTYVSIKKFNDEQFLRQFKPNGKNN
jgi:hypothetical protein